MNQSIPAPQKTSVLKTQKHVTAPLPLTTKHKYGADTFTEEENGIEKHHPPEKLYVVGKQQNYK